MQRSTRRHRRDLVGAACGALVALAPRTGPCDEPPTAELRFEAEAGAACFSESELRRGVAERMGYDPFRVGAGRTLSVRLEGRGPYRGEVALSDASGREVGRRDLEDADCAAVRDTLVLAATLALDPLAATRPKAPAPPPLATPSESGDAATAGDAAPRDSTAPQSAPPSRAKALSVRVSVGPRALFGVAPGDVAGVSGAIGLVYGRLGVDIEGTTTLSGTSGTSAGAAQGTATLATLVPCVRLGSAGALGVDLCATLTGGALFSRGADVSRETSRTDAVWTAGLRARGEWRITRAFGAALTAGGAIPLQHDELSVDVAGVPQVVWKTPAVGAELGLAAFALFP